MKNETENLSLRPCATISPDIFHDELAGQARHDATMACFRRLIRPDEVCGHWAVGAKDVSYRLAAAAISSRPVALQDEQPSRLIAAVMRHAQGGELPLFAWTLGLPRADWLAMVGTLFPELGLLTPPMAREYAILASGRPAEFDALVRLLLDARPQAKRTPESVWLAHAIAAATQGERHLWQDLGLRRRDDLTFLFEDRFPQLHAANQHNTRWKKFLYGELASRLNQPGLQAPGCGTCSHFKLCFPASE